MKLTELIASAQLKLQQHGDLDVLTEDHWDVNLLSHEVSKGEFDKSWNMPKGFEYIMLLDGR